MADYQTIVATDTVNAALLTRAVNNFLCAQNLCAGATAPASPIAGQLWLDTSGSPRVLKIRNSANSAWITIIPDADTTGGGLERIISVPVLIGTLSATDNKYLWIAGPGTVTISDVVLVTEAGIASSGTDYWTFQVRNLTASVNLRSSAKSTNGAAITADTAYALGLDQNLSPSSGAVLQLQCTKAGSAGNLTELLAVVRMTVTS